jgi:hypothetical protein
MNSGLVFKSTVVEGETRLAREIPCLTILRDKAINRQRVDLRVDLHMGSRHVGPLLLSRYNHDVSCSVFE